MKNFTNTFNIFILVENLQKEINFRELHPGVFFFGIPRLEIKSLVTLVKSSENLKQKVNESAL